MLFFFQLKVLEWTHWCRTRQLPMQLAGNHRLEKDSDAFPEIGEIVL
jgi:hypothetical protein